MSQSLQHQVFQALSRSRAQLERSVQLADGLALAQWRNAHDATQYNTPGHHTFGCYLEGGYGTFRRDLPQLKGAPQRLCILPAEHQSAWVVNGELRFIHLYVSPQPFALGAVQLLDREPRELQLQERTFIEDPQQAARFRQLALLDWQEPGERLLCSSLSQAILDQALLTQVGRRNGLQLKGGLAPQTRRRLQEYIEAHLEQPLGLAELAEQAALSGYHFARMFTQSFGLPPHRYVLMRRLQRATELLASSPHELGDIALACGFASASHFSTRFRQHFGATPSQYRAARCI